MGREAGYNREVCIDKLKIQTKNVLNKKINYRFPLPDQILNIILTTSDFQPPVIPASVESRFD
jgi:hypothetical protein